MLLKRQKPLARSRVAWWPGGRTRAIARDGVSAADVTARTQLTTPPHARCGGVEGVPTVVHVVIVRDRFQLCIGKAAGCQDAVVVFASVCELDDGTGTRGCLEGEKAAQIVRRRGIRGPQALAVKVMMGLNASVELLILIIADIVMFVRISNLVSRKPLLNLHRGLMQAHNARRVLKDGWVAILVE